MDTSIGLGITQCPELRQTMNLAQHIDCAKLLAFHPSHLEEILNSLNKNPDRAEEILGSNRNSDSSGGARGIFNYLHETKGLAVSGFILDPDTKKFVDEEQKGIVPEPDAILVQRENIHEVPQIFFSSIIMPVRTPQLLQEIIPVQYRMARRLYKDLVKFRTWSNDVAIRGYSFLIHRQREFINTLDPLHKNIYPAPDLAKDLGLHETTVGRLFNGRTIAIESPNKETRQAFPSRSLLCTKSDRVSYFNLHQLNDYFLRESESKKCRSDREISEQVGFSRRAVTKYRLQAKIPDRSGREKAYRTNPELRYKASKE